MPRAAVVSFRLGGPDGVSVEAAKWQWALTELGHSVTTIAGSGTADVVLPGLAAGTSAPIDRGQLDGAFAGADLVVVENLCSLPLNADAADAVASALRGRAAIFRHHDLPWQRPVWVDHPPPPDDPAWMHVTINELSRGQLAERGLQATTIYNAFATNIERRDRDEIRLRLGVAPGERLLLHPTRAIARKNVPRAVAIAEEIGATYWLLGPAEDGYGPELDAALGAARVRVLRDIAGFDVAGAYAACDAVVYPSTWEGFGNPTIESALSRRALAVSRYPVLGELLAFGFEWFDTAAPAPFAAWLARPDTGLLDRNQDVARRHFSLEQLPARIDALLAAAPWGRHG